MGEFTMRQVDLIVMTGRSGASGVERLVEDVRAANACDLVDKALVSSAFHSIVVSTNDAVLGDRVDGLPGVIVELDPEDESFYFGRRLQALIAKHKIERVVYLGGGSAPLLSASALRDLAEQVRAADRLFVANNFFSVDFCAFTPASALLTVDPPPNDNRLGWLLANEAGLPARELERNGATMFDIDTPTDLLVLSLHPDVSPHTRTCLDGLTLDARHIEAACAVFVQRGEQALIAGRVNAKVLAYLEREALCRTRVFSEERGMRADGRLEQGEVRSLLGMHMMTVGVERFFREVVPQLAQAAFLDDRVLWAHCHVWPPAADRFHSDLYRVEAIVDPFIREFTEAAMSCPIPVVLGGHSLVSGGLYVLIEAAWARSGLHIPRLVEAG
jgi:CTP:molybdopterin cytidylyltransferase MocA